MSRVCHVCHAFVSTKCAECVKPTCALCVEQHVCFRVTDDESRQAAKMLVVLQKHTMRGLTVYRANSMFGPAYDHASALHNDARVHSLHIFHTVTLNERGVMLFRDASNKNARVTCDYELAEFYNYLLDSETPYYRMMNDDERVLFKGLGRGMLCALLQSYGLADKRDKVIVLEAYGKDPRNDDMRKLVALYESLSFKTIAGTPEQYIANNIEVPMRTTIGELLDACNDDGFIRNLFAEGDVGVIVQ